MSSAFPPRCAESTFSRTLCMCDHSGTMHTYVCEKAHGPHYGPDPAQPCGSCEWTDESHHSNPEEPPPVPAKANHMRNPSIHLALLSARMAIDEARDEIQALDATSSQRPTPEQIHLRATTKALTQAISSLITVIEIIEQK